MPAVIDSNVIYSGLYSRKGASNKILGFVADGIVTPALSVGLYEEYCHVLARKPLADELEATEREEFLDFFCSAANLTEIYFMWRPCLNDPKDDLVLELAVASGSPYILTFNTKDFGPAKKFGVEPITPVVYLNQKLYKQ